MKEKMANAAAELIAAVTRLIKVKTIVTFALVYVFAALTLAGETIPDGVMTIITTVIAFYFGTQSGKKE